MISGSQHSSTNTPPEEQAVSNPDFYWLHEQSQTKKIPFDLTMTALSGNLEPINKTDKISPEDKQWLYLVAFRNGHPEAGKNLTLDNKLDLLLEAAETNDANICRNVLVLLNEKELTNDREEELEAIFNEAMHKHHFNIAHMLLENFYAAELIDNNTICENVLWAASSLKHYEALQWLLTKAPIPAESIESHIKGSVLHEMVENDAVEILKLILLRVDAKDKVNEDFLRNLADAARHALHTNKLDILKLLLPYTNRKTIKDLLQEAAGKRLLPAMPFLLARAEEIAKKGEDTKPISHEKQADYLRQLLDGIQEDLLLLKTQAQAQGNEAVINLLEQNTLLLSYLRLLTPPLIFSQAAVQSSNKRKKGDENLLEDKNENKEDNLASPKEPKSFKKNYL